MEDGELYTAMDRFQPDNRYNQRRHNEQSYSRYPQNDVNRVFPQMPHPHPRAKRFSNENMDQRNLPYNHLQSPPDRPPPLPSYKPPLEDLPGYQPSNYNSAPPNRPPKPSFLEENPANSSINSTPNNPPIIPRTADRWQAQPYPINPPTNFGHRYIPENPESELYLRIDNPCAPDYNSQPDLGGNYFGSKRSFHNEHINVNQGAPFGGGHYPQQPPPVQPRPPEDDNPIYEPTPTTERHGRFQKPSSNQSSFSARSPIPSPGPHTPSRTSSSTSSERKSHSNSVNLPFRGGSKDSRGSRGSSSSGDNIDIESTKTTRSFQTIIPPIENRFMGLGFGNPIPVMQMPPFSTEQPRNQTKYPGVDIKPPDVHGSPKPSSGNVVDQSWYRNVDRTRAEEEIKRDPYDGYFIVRPGKGADKPFSLTVCCDKETYNLQIRKRQDGNFALGKEKDNERSFPNVLELINFHMESPLVLAEGKGSIVLRCQP